MIINIFLFVKDHIFSKKAAPYHNPIIFGRLGCVEINMHNFCFFHTTTLAGNIRKIYCLRGRVIVKRVKSMKKSYRPLLIVSFGQIEQVLTHYVDDQEIPSANYLAPDALVADLKIIIE